MDGIIFDVDGTLWDSTEAVARSWNQAIEENTDFSLSLTADWLKSLFGKTMDEITLALFPSCPKEERDRIGYLCFNYENRLLETDHGVLYPDVARTLESLSQKTDLYIVSNCQCGYIEVFLKTMGLGKYIKDFLCFGQTQVPKNESIRLLMERNHLQDVVYVGDTSGDFDACQKADVPFIYASYGFGDIPDPPRQIGAIRNFLLFLDCRFSLFMFLVQDYIAVFSIIQHLQSLPPVVSFHTHDNIKRSESDNHIFYHSLIFLY